MLGYCTIYLSVIDCCKEIITFKTKILVTCIFLYDLTFFRLGWNLYALTRSR